MALLNKDRGYGQIEPTHLSAQRNGQIYAQLPCKADITELQNGQFVKYDYAKGEVNYNGDGTFKLVYNEVKLYDPRHSYKDFVFRTKDFTDGKIFPRVMNTVEGDIITTNLVDITTAHGPGLVGKKLVPSTTTGILTEQASPAAGDQVWIVAKAMTMADGSPAVKIQRIA